MRRSSSLSLSTWFSFSLDSRCPFFSCLSDFSPVRTRRGGHTAADPRTGGEPPVHPSRPEDAGFSPSGRPSQSRWVSCRLPGNGHHSGMAPLQGLISLRQGKKGKLAVACPPQIPAPIATLTSALVWKRRNHAFRSTWDNATTFKEQNIIACRCPDIFTSKRHHLFQTPRGHRDSPSLSRSTSSVVVDHLLSIRACFPGCLGLENAFLDLCCATGHEETSFVRLRLMRQIGGLK